MNLRHTAKAIRHYYCRRLPNLVSFHVFSFLAARGVDTVFYLPGGGCMHLLDSLGSNHDLNAVSLLHEQAVAVAAESYANATGKMGVALATTGPGATALIDRVLRGEKIGYGDPKSQSDFLVVSLQWLVNGFSFPASYRLLKERRVLSSVAEVIKMSPKVEELLRFAERRIEEQTTQVN